MIKQLGSQGMVFFIFSAADLHWPELHKLMPHSENQIEGESEQDAAKRRCQNLIDNPHITAWFFENRFKSFLKDVLIPKWNLKDWWYRFEWQHHDSIHIHGIRICKDALVIDWKKMKEDNKMMIRVVQYLNSLIMTINPEVDAPVPDRHPCQKHNDELCDNLQDYIELINKLQRYTRCSLSYCLHTNRESQQSCRFGYPKDNVEQTFICDDDHGHPKLIIARNDPYINLHDQLQLQGWHANVDLKPVLSIHTAL